MTLPSQWATACGRAFRLGNPERVMSWERFTILNDRWIHYGNVALLKRDYDTGQCSITWPRGFTYHHPAQLRSILNSLLSSMQLRPWYTFSLAMDLPEFYMRARKDTPWRRQGLVPGRWYPLPEGELARMALMAERKLNTGVKTP